MQVLTSVKLSNQTLESLMQFIMISVGSRKLISPLMVWFQMNFIVKLK